MSASSPDAAGDSERFATVDHERGSGSGSRTLRTGRDGRCGERSPSDVMTRRSDSDARHPQSFEQEVEVEPEVRAGSDHEAPSTRVSPLHQVPLRWNQVSSRRVQCCGPYHFHPVLSSCAWRGPGSAPGPPRPHRMRVDGAPVSPPIVRSSSAAAHWPIGRRSPTWRSSAERRVATVWPATRRWKTSTCTGSTSR